MIFGRKANRRRAESKLSRVRLPNLARWRARAQRLLVPPLVGIALYAGARGAAALLDQPVHKLVVEGTFQRVTPMQVEAAVAPDLGHGFMSLDLADLRHRVQKLEWVDQVNVGRSWPDTLVVHVTEHQAAAHWGDTGLLNVRGELFTDHEQHALPELPKLAGPAGSEHEVARRYLAVRGRLADAGLALESLQMDDRGAWTLDLGGGQEIRLGRRDVDERLRRFFDVVAPALAGDMRRIQYVDLRYTNGFAVGWADQPHTELAAARAPDRG